jgi:hypothetical protein
VPLGVVQSVLVCQPVAVATAQDQQYCAAVSGQAYAPRSYTAYLIDPSQSARLEASIAPFDYAYAAGLWSFGFSTIVALFFASHAIGSVVGFIRRG